MLGPLGAVEFSKKSKLLGLVVPEVVTADVKKLNSDFDERLLPGGGTILSAGFEKLVSDFENKLLREVLLSLLVDKPNVRGV